MSEGKMLSMSKCKELSQALQYLSPFFIFRSGLITFVSVLKEGLKDIHGRGGEDDPDWNHDVEQTQADDLRQLEAEHDLGG